MWGKRKGGVRSSTAAQAVVMGVKVHGGEAGSGGLVYFDLDLRARFNDGSTREFHCRVGGPFSGTDLRFTEGDIVPVRYDPDDRSKIALDEDAMNDDQTSRSETFAAARMAKARACMDAHNEAKAAGDSKEAQRQLAAGAIANAEQVQLGERYKRLRQQRPDWQPAKP